MILFASTIALAGYILVRCLFDILRDRQADRAYQSNLASYLGAGSTLDI